MKVTVRPADLKSDRRLIIDTLLRFLTPLSDDRRFSWLYENNPHGRARAWVACSPDDDTVIGMAAAFPRRVYVNGHEQMSWVLGDFCVNDVFRSLGPALTLQRACLAEVDAGAVAFCYDFPSKGMMAVYKRLQIASFRDMLRLAKPLRVNRKMKELIKSPIINSALSKAGNLVLKLSERKRRGDSTLTLSLHKGYCGNEFTELARNIGSCYGACIQRSAEYLNWRYLENPLHQYELFTARREGMLLGYAILLQEGEDTILVDLFGVEADVVLSALIVHVVALLMSREVQTVSAAVIETHPWRPLLEWHGFKVREVSPMVIYVPSSSGSAAGIIKEPKWLFMQGDRDS
jgi:hypothetical protein